MVEIEQNIKQVVYYPKTQKSYGPYTLVITSELSQKEWVFDNVPDLARYNDYYMFDVDYSEIDSGEFNYTILDKDYVVVDTGLLRIGIDTAKYYGYGDDTEIIQYDMYAGPTERYEDKDVTVTENGEYIITPSSGYDAISKVNLTVDVPTGYTQEDLDNAYASGYTSGYTDGQADCPGPVPTISITSTSPIAYDTTLIRWNVSKSDFVDSIKVTLSGSTSQEMTITGLTGQVGVESNFTIPANTGLTAITYMIIATMPDYPGISDFVEVTQEAETFPVATSITLNVPSVIIGEGKATVTVEPSDAVVDLFFTADESSPTEAAIDQEGNIYVLANGITTICVEDLNTGLKDCKDITCVLEPSEIYVQTLINEGFANVVTGAGGTYIEILESCPYSAAEILDLGEVARNEKKLSGDTNNVIIWDQPLPNGWANADITSIYSGKTLNFTPRARMFWALGDVDNFEITFAGGSYQVNDYPWGSGLGNNGVFAPRYNSTTGPDYFWKSPKNLVVNFTGAYGTVSQTMFAEMQTTTALTITVNGFFTCVDWTGMYEDSYNLETLTLNGMFRYDFTRLCHNMFKNCEKLQSVPYVVAWGRDHVQNTIRPHTQPGGSADAGGMFQNCPALQSIGLTLDFECISLSGCVVDGETQAALTAPMIECANLTDVRIKNLGHNSWDFTDANGKLYAPKMDVASIEYLLNNVQDETGNGYTLTFSTLHQGQISSTAITNAQSKGWTIAWK